MARCDRGCPYFLAPEAADERVLKQRAAAGIMVRGACRREPLVQHKQPDEFCGEHPELAVQRAKLLGQAFAEALAPLLKGKP